MRFPSALPIALAAFAFVTPLRADPVSEITAFSIFKEVPLDKLAKGEVISASAPTMRFPRGLGVESLFVVRLPVANANEAQMRWDGLRHSELKIYQHRDLPRRPTAQDFQILANAPRNSSVSRFIASTEKLDPERPDLQMSAVEAKSMTRFEPGNRGSIPPGVVKFWSGLLEARASAFASGGLACQPPYQFRGASVRPAEEASELLRERPSIRKQFSALSSTMTGGGGGNPSLFYDLFDVEGRAAVSLGASFSRPAGDGIQSGTVQFYSSDGYFVMLTFSQMWPIEVDGRAAALVWRGDLLSSKQLGELRGIERAGASVAMRKEIQKNISAMTKDISPSR